jgi:KAP family P-loop domain
MRQIEPTKFRFKKHASIGASDAEADRKFLNSCFVDNGDLRQLLDLTSHRRLIIGRTGSGKSALIAQVAESADNCIPLDLESLSLAYISNSDVIKFFEGIGVNLDIFYSLLWRHVFTVELLRKKLKLTELNHPKFLDRLAQIFDRDKKKGAAIKYLQEWGSNFWEETEYRIKEFVKKLENSLTATAGSEVSSLKLNLDASRTFSDEVRGEVVNRAQKVVNEVQIQDLGKVIDLLADDFFDDVSAPYYITIDKLDESWADDRIKYKLIRALLETVRTFVRIPGVKVIVALRVDLLERVFEQTRNSGFQEEKYFSMYLQVRWTHAQLRQLIDRRVEALLREHFTNKQVGTTDVFPNKVNGHDAFDYMCDRSFGRPRDIILFVNACLDLVEGKSSIPASTIKEAEAEYSRQRLRSLGDEWSGDFPHFVQAAQILNGRPGSFKVRDISPLDLDNFILNVCTDLPADSLLYRFANELTNDRRTFNSFISYLIKMFYRTGIVGVKPDAFNEIQWAFREKTSIADGQINEGSALHIHPMVWRALGVHIAARN